MSVMNSKRRRRIYKRWQEFMQTRAQCGNGNTEILGAKLY